MDTTSSKSNKVKKKGNNKLKAVLRGPKGQPLIIVTGEESERFTTKLKELGTVPKSSDSEIEVTEEKSKNTLKKELVFGVNEIVRSLKRSECNLSGLVVTNPLSSHLQLTLQDISLRRKVPCLFLDNLHDTSHSLHLSSLTAFAFKNSCQDSGSICHPLYCLFVEIYEEKTGKRVQNSLSLVEDSNIKETIKTTSKTTIRPKYEQLYTLKTQRKFSPDLDLKFLPEKLDEECITMSEKHIYFPDRFRDENFTVVMNVSVECASPSSFADQSTLNKLMGTPESDPSEPNERVKYLKTEVIQISTARKDQKRKIRKRSNFWRTRLKL